MKKKLLSTASFCLIFLTMTSPALAQDIASAVTEANESVREILGPLKILIKSIAGLISLWFIIQLFAKLKSGNQQVAKEVGVFVMAILVFFAANTLVDSAFGV